MTEGGEEGEEDDKEEDSPCPHKEGGVGENALDHKGLMEGPQVQGQEDMPKQPPVKVEGLSVI